jgi:hypothetical protein
MTKDARVCGRKRLPGSGICLPLRNLSMEISRCPPYWRNCPDGAGWTRSIAEESACRQKYSRRL